MSYRPQFVYPPTPAGFRDEEFEYYFDTNTTLGLSTPAAGQLSGRITLQFQSDAEFLWRATQISGTTGTLCIRFYDPRGNELAAITVENDRSYAGYLQGPQPVGRLPVPFEGEVRIPAGGFLEIDLYSLVP